MRLAVFAFCVALACAGCSRPAGTSYAQSVPATTISQNVIDNRQLLVLAVDAPDTMIAEAERLGYELMNITRLDSLGETLIDLRIPEGHTIPEAIAEIEALWPGTTAGASHGYRIQSLDSNGAFANQMIGWPAQGCTTAWKVGLIDTGIPEGHPDLVSGRIVQRTFHDANLPPAQDHGVLMAELLIGDGRLTGSKLYSANVADPRQSNGDLAGVGAILQAVDWLRAEGVNLINVSLAGPVNKLLTRALRQAAADGTVFVAAAGNVGPSAPPQYPAAFPFVIAVTAVDWNGSAYRLAARGDHIDLSAPGVDIVVRPEGKLRILSGTSAAAPFVTAAIAADPALQGVTSIDAIRNRLAANVTDLGPAGKDEIFGAGLVRAPENCAVHSG